MITTDRYRQVTGDFTSSDAEVARCLADALQSLEEYLDRELAYGERTEDMRPDREGRIWPRVTPIETADGYTIDGYALTGIGPFTSAVSFIDPDTFLTVTYTGGYLDATADPEDTGGPALPFCIVRDLAWAANRLANPAPISTAVGFPAGATAVTLGDASVTFGNGQAVAQDTTSWWSKRTRGFRYRPIHAGPVYC